MASALLSDFDLHLLGEGKHFRSYEKLGAHLTEFAGRRGARFAVWAPNAERVSVIGPFNDWNPHANPLASSDVGVWSAFVDGIESGALYKYHIESRSAGNRPEYKVDKADPYGFAAEIRPHTASRVWDIDTYTWRDGQWMSSRRNRNSLDSPVTIYEVHLGSWRRMPEEGNRWLTYREIAPLLAEYVHDAGYTHVELLPVMEHPFDGSWGYETIGYYAPTSRFGDPTDFMYMVDHLHQHEIGVILDWVPAHFPKDEAGLGYFDGTHLFEHADPRLGEQPDWNTLIFNYGRREVKNFLIGNALFWCDKYHVDGLRVDAVAAMLYLNYGRREGQWIPNRFGGKENLDAIQFIRELNEHVYSAFPDVMMIAEESTAWPMVSRPTYLGGLGFGSKWNMGWMHDMLAYMSLDPVFRSYNHNYITFSLMYAFSENFVLPFSHDEVVYGKGSMIGKMPGDEWRKFANLRVLYGTMFGHPGKKLLFMGNEFGQWSEWSHDGSLDWRLLKQPYHSGLLRWVRDLNTLYRGEPSLFELDYDAAGFEWIDCNDSQRSVISFIRRARNRDDILVFVCNFTPVPRHNYRVGVPAGGYWKEVLNSDAPLYGGGGQGNEGGLNAAPLPIHGRPFSLNATLPPLGVVVFQPEVSGAGRK
ncbi:MAG TPA: 1,4-alpha-glucan branching protein GlgB [Bryobacteraceae bacterium]